MPVVPASDWIKAQKLIEQGIFKITYQVNNKTSFVVPSSHVLRNIPSTLTTPLEKQNYLRVSSPQPLASQP